MGAAFPLVALFFVLLICGFSLAVREGARSNEDTATPAPRAFNERVSALARSITSSPFGRNISTADARRVAFNVLGFGENLDLPPALLLAIIQVESGFRVNARNGRSAGLMQVRHRVVGQVRVAPDQVTVPGHNIALGAQLLNEYHACYVRDGLETPRDFDYTIMAYNVGPSGLRRNASAALRYLTKVRTALHYWTPRIP